MSDSDEGDVISSLQSLREALRKVSDQHKEPTSGAAIPNVPQEGIQDGAAVADNDVTDLDVEAHLDDEPEQCDGDGEKNKCPK